MKDAIPQPGEAEAQAGAEKLKAELAATRMILSADQLATLVNPSVRLELHIPNAQAWLFSIDGVLMGKKVQGCLFAGECMLVHAFSQMQACTLAQDGLRTTIELLHEEYGTRDERLNPDVYDGLQVHGGGRKGGKMEREPQVAPKLRAMMDHVIGKKPWKH